MAISKVVYNSNTLIDLTNDTVLAENVAEGITFHLANGQSAVGTAIGLIPPVANNGNTSANDITISKVIYNNNTLIDLTNDTITPENVEEGITFHLANGQPAIGTATNPYGRLLNSIGDYLCINTGARIMAKKF
jgi:hypothetical protein